MIAWSFAELQNPQSDANKLIEAAHFQSATGQHIDAVAANMEKDLSPAKVEVYSHRLRENLGANYPMIAVVYSPLNLAPQVAQIPWKMLGHYYDVIAPMNYWNSKYKKLEPYEYTLSTIKKVRELVGRPDIEVHIIGDGMGTTSESITKFMKACHDGEATSASLYPNQRMTVDQMDCLSHYSEFFPVNSRFRLAAFQRAALKDYSSNVVETPANVDPSQTDESGRFL